MHGAIKRTRKLSAVSSNRRLFAERVNTLDNPHGRRWYDLYNSYLDTLGGDDAITEATRTTIRRVATLQCVLEQREADFVRTGKVTRYQTAEYQSLSSTLTRLMKTLGLFNTAKAASEDDGDDLDPLTYANGGHSRKRSVKRAHLDDEQEDDR